jgi:uncharacterized membrane protein YqgA involved in biofilm formation
MFVGLGTLINVTTIVVGSLIGLLIGKRFKESTRDLITTCLGIVTLLAAADSIRHLWDSNFTMSFPKGWALLLVLASLLVGAVIGSALRIEDRVEAVGHNLKQRFDEHGSSPFVEGFASASLLFVIGPMAILGSISDGMHTGIQQLALKSILDGVTSIAFASTLGWSVALSAIPVGIYQLAWTGIGFGLGNILSSYQIMALTVTGGILLLGISLRLLKIKDVAVGNLLPALFLAPVFALALHQFA